MNILELAILKKMVGGGGGSGTDNYNDLSNLPQINGETLAGNKTAENLGLQDEITNENKLDADLVDDAESTNKFVTAQEKETWNAKQNAIDSSHKLSSDLVDDTNHTNKFVTSQEKETWNAKQNAIDDLSTIRSGATAGATAVQPAELNNYVQNSSLVEVVNDGAKNKVDVADATVSANGYVVENASCDLPTGTYKVQFTTTASSGNVIVTVKNSSGASVGSVTIAQTAGTKSGDLTLTGTGVTFSVQSTSAATISNFMICTKSQFGISPAYVPYAESNAVLTQKVKELEHTDNIFGYHINPNESDPYEAVTYVANARGMVPAKMTGGGFSYGSWGSAFFLPRPCVLNFDGTVAYYLDPNDYSKKIDGTAATIDSSNTTGNVMLEFPKIWVKRVPGTADGERTVYIADRKVDPDYKCFSNINSQNTEINKFYIHAYNGTIHSSQMRSLSGVTLNSTCAPNYTARQEILAAKANNPSGSNVMWFTDTWSDIMLLFDLLYLMGKSLDVQRTFGQGLSGGSETAMRAYVTGSLNNKGLFWGDTTGTNMAIKVLGIENLWGCRWNRIAGMINVAGNLKVKMTYGTADGSTATEYETPTESTDNTQTLTATGYLDYGTILKSNGYVSKIQADNSKGYKITSVTGGTDSKYYCDYYYQASAANTKYYALFGGNSGNGVDCGFSVNLNAGAASTNWSVGGALSCKP